MILSSKEQKRTAYCESNPDIDRALLYLASFSNGNIKREGGDHVKFSSYKSTGIHKSSADASKSCPKILVTDTGRMQYYGSNKGQWIAPASLISQFLVGVFNNNTRKIKFYNAVPVHCKPVLEVSNDAVQESEAKSFSEKTDGLTTAFGSKRKKKAVNSRLKYSTNETITATNISNTVTEAAAKLKQENPTVEVKKPDEISAIPPQNRSATTVEGIYQLKDIITESEYQALEEPSKIFSEAKLSEVQQWKTNAVYCSFVTQFLEKFTGNIPKHTAKLLFYFNYMAMFLKLGYKDFRKKDPIPDIPEVFKNNLLNKFVITSFDESHKMSRSMPTNMKDKLMAYATVLALILNSYSLDPTCLLRDYKASFPKLCRIAYALGCHVSNKKIDGLLVKLIELKLPLFQPSEKPFLKRKK